MRKFLIASFVLVLALAVLATPAQADDDLRATIRDEIAKYQAQDESTALSAHWDNGLRFKGGDWKGAIGGRIMFDVLFADDEDFVTASGQANRPNAGFFRRVRLFTSGQIGGHVGYKLQLDFAPSQAGAAVAFRDMYVEYNGLRDCYGCGAPNIRVGHYKHGHGLEQMTSSRFITFMERSIVTNALTTGRATGLMLHDTFRGGQLGYSVSVFGTDTADWSVTNANGGTNLQSGYSVGGRVWWAPWYDCSCSCRRFHVGASVVSSTEITGGVTHRARPAVYGTGARIATATNADATDTLHYGAEMALVYGPWSVQAEYLAVNVDSVAGGDPSYSGYYAQVSYWLTGECRNWKGGKYGRTSPCCDWLDNDCCCKGGWEVAARYNFLDLTDGAIAAGEVTAIEFGVNWHLNPNARIMLNVGSTTLEVGAVDESLMVVGMRFQVDF